MNSGEIAGETGRKASRDVSVGVPSQELLRGVLAGDRAWLGRAITLVESRKAADRPFAEELLEALLPHAGKAHRVGITGVPGVGKSTFIDALGSHLTSGGHRVAVLAVDPSSSRTGGSILGDKTRMARLSTDSNAFIRPSPAAGTLGGVTRRTRESIIVIEAAGYDVVLVETVGAGQSEIAVSEMVDFFLVLMLPGAGDALQGIKKGVLEIAEMIAVNKADGANLERARSAVAEYRSALRILTPAFAEWSPPVVQCSGLTGTGIEELWAKVEQHRKTFQGSGAFRDRRRQQRLRWFDDLLEEAVLTRFWAEGPDAARLAIVRDQVEDATVLPSRAVRELLG